MIGKEADNALSPALQRYYVQRGFESAMRMGEDAPMVAFMRLEIEKLLADASYLDDPRAVIAYWDRGFQTGVVQRVHSWHAEPVPTGVECGDTCRMSGTLRVRHGRKS
jgi:hypothetical protein